MVTIARTRVQKRKEALGEIAFRCVMAIDYGRKRIGLAVADEDGGVARPLATIERKNRRQDMRRLKEIVREQRIKTIVVGHPLRLDGTRGEMAEETERFAERLRKQIGVPVELVDERLTSWQAEQLLAEREGSRNLSVTKRAEKGRKRKARGHDVDAVAAAVILRDYLERKKTQGRP